MSQKNEFAQIMMKNKNLLDQKQFMFRNDGILKRIEEQMQTGAEDMEGNHLDKIMGFYKAGVRLTTVMTKKIRMTSYSNSRKFFSRDWTTNWQKKALVNLLPRARPKKFHRLKLVAKTCKTTRNKFRIELGYQWALL